MTISKTLINQHAFNYRDFRNLMKELIRGNENNYTEQYKDWLTYIEKNDKLMDRLEKHVTLNKSLSKFIGNKAESWTWLVIAEPWCGDVGQNLPVLNAIAEASPAITMKIILRDQHPEVMDQYLTNGARSVPVLVCLKASDLKELGRWGPRPEPAQKIMEKHKYQNDPPEKKDAIKKVQLWYEKDNQNTIQEELEELIWQWANH